MEVRTRADMYDHGEIASSNGVTYEIFRKWDATKDDVPNMGGFIERQSEKYSETPGDASFVIKAYSEKKTALLAELAKNFAFFDSYVSHHRGYCPYIEPMAC